MVADLATILSSTDKVEMYKKFGFKNHEIGDSVWGGEAWHKMDIVLDWWISHD